MKVHIYQGGYTKEHYLATHTKTEKGHYRETGYYDNPEAVVFKYQGYLEVHEFDKEKCWDLLNWSCWTDKKPEELTGTSMTHCNSDIILHPEGTNKFYVALSIGWKVCNSLTEAEKDLCDGLHTLWVLNDYTDKDTPKLTII